MAEMLAVRTHAQQGFELVLALDYHKIICDIVRYHHENWNGTGYPLGLAGENIPPFARMARVADTFDAMTSSRAYRKAASWKDARMLINAESGSTFDPQMVALLNFVLEEEG